MTLPRLIFVTGKGGTGKSTIAAALALALARRLPTTLADLDQRLSALRALGVKLNGARAKPVNDNLEVMALAPRTELESFISRIVPLKAVSRRMLKSRTFGYVTAALPGLEAFLMLERLRLLAGKAAAENRFAVIDGPATGHALELLDVANGVTQLAPFGTLNRLAAGVEEFLKDADRFGVILTLRPEELALRETLEAVSTLRTRMGIAHIIAVLNGVAAPLFSAAEIAKLDALGAHARLAERRRATAEFAAHARRELKRVGASVVETPMLFEPALGRNALESIADALALRLARE